MMSEEFKEELREEIRKIIREEFQSLIFEKREFHTALKAYMGSLLYDELHNYKMFKAGFRPDYAVEYVRTQRELGSISFHVDDAIDLHSVYSRLVEEARTDSSYETFESVLLYKAQESEKINWTHQIVRSKDINQQSIFDLLYSLDPRIAEFESFKRRRLIEFVCNSFLKNGFSLSEANVNNSFSKWRRRKKIEHS